jgi:TPR repeat protein
MEMKAPYIQRETEMKKILLVMFIALFTASSAFCGEFEEILKKAEQGDAWAQCQVGSMYYRGEGNNSDYGEQYKQSVIWYTKAAEQGVVDAQVKLGYMYAFGQIVAQNDTTATFWWLRAASQGDTYVSCDRLNLLQNLSEVYYNLGIHFFYGEGKNQDYKIAAHWIEKSAKLGYASAQACLGEMYYFGKGVPQNFKLSYTWESLAAAQGHEKAIKNRDITAKKLTPQQLSEAQDLAAKIQYQIDNQAETRTQPPAKADIDKIIGSGTGFFITRDGYILTCLHVVQDAARIEIYVGDKTYPASLVRSDPNNDLAILKVNGSFPAVAFSPHRSAKIGEDVFTFGYPNPGLQGVSAKYTKGTISSLTGFQDDLRLYQISVPVQPGNSGGALLDENGNILGVVIAMLNAKTTFEISGSLPQNVNYAVKSLYAQAMIDTLPDVAGILLSPSRSKSNAIENAQNSTVMVVCYE